MSPSATGKAGWKTAKKLMILGIVMIIGLFGIGMTKNYFFGMGRSVQSGSSASPMSSYQPNSAFIGSSSSPEIAKPSSDSPRLSYGSTISFKTKSPADAMEKAAQRVRDVGGSVMSLDVTSKDKESAIASFKVPTSELTNVSNDLTALGVDVSKELTAHDVGPSIKSIDDRLTAKQDEIDRVSKQADQATGTQKDVLQRNLTLLRSQLSQIESEKNDVAAEVTYAILGLTINETTVGLSDRSTTSAFAHAATAGVHFSAAVLGLVVSGLGFVLPIALVLLLLVVSGATIRLGARRAWIIAKPLFR